MNLVFPSEQEIRGKAYREICPQTDEIYVITAWVKHIDKIMPGSGYALDAYYHLSNAHRLQGITMDELEPWIVDDKERFMTRVVFGPDGHRYWNGAKGVFELNERDHAGRKRRRKPRHWWFAHENNMKLVQGDGLERICADQNCINPVHHRFAPRSERMSDLVIPERTILGSLQAKTMELGRVPSLKEWRDENMSPCARTITRRFGSWARALTAAGLTFRSSGYQGRKWTTDECQSAVSFVQQMVGHKKITAREFERYREALVEQDLPTSRHTIRNKLGGWEIALNA